jgi:RNA polymerase sigma-70 factor (ECF subfamily)
MSSEAVLQSLDTLVEVTAPDAPPASAPAIAETVESTSVALSNEELLEAVGRGATDALSVLFRRHGRAVLNVAWRILRDESEADDLRQEVFLYLFERAHLYDARKSSASSWIMQITYHRAIDRRRYLSSRQHYNVDELDEERLGSPVAQPLTDHLDGKAILERLKGQLSPDQQQALNLHFFEGYSLQEIAEKSGQSIGNVRHHYYRALEKLRSSVFSTKHG